MSVNAVLKDLVCENRIDLLVLAEYVDNLNALRAEFLDQRIYFEEGITVGCERIIILSRIREIEPGFQNKYCSM